MAIASEPASRSSRQHPYAGLRDRPGRPRLRATVAGDRNRDLEARMPNARPSTGTHPIWTTAFGSTRLTPPMPGTRESVNIETPPIRLSSGCSYTSRTVWARATGGWSAASAVARSRFRTSPRREPGDDEPAAAPRSPIERWRPTSGSGTRLSLRRAGSGSFISVSRGSGSPGTARICFCGLVIEAREGKGLCHSPA
jgi:hypothetical protein